MRMNIESFISDIGGRQVLIEDTGLTKGRISQWVTEKKIPAPWVKYLCSKYPKQCAKNGIRATNHCERRKKAA